MAGGWVSCFLHLPVVVPLAVLLSCLFIFPSVAAAEIYKWKDNNGNVIYSDSPPSESKAEKVKIKNDMRFELPPSSRNEKPKNSNGNNSAAGQRLRDVRDLNVLLYVTDW